MSLPISIGSKLLCLGLLAQVTLSQDNPCITFGVDFQDGGSFFQNSLSNDPFTFVQEFEGCQNDTSQNLLVDPVGNEYQCTDTPLLPSDTPELSTCPIDKGQLSSGDWTIIVISNNGDAAPIAYQRDFFLTVAPQNTTTFTPTVTATVTSTPIVNSTVVVTDTDTVTLPQSTVTEPSTTISRTRTVTPHRVTVKETKTLFTVTKIRPTVIVSKSTSTVTAHCSVPPHRHTPDPTCRIHPTLIHPAALVPSSAKFRIKDRSIEDKAAFLEGRSERLAHMVKRAPDQPTVTVTDTNTADYVTVNSTVTAAASTLTVTSTSEVTTTITPSPIVVISGRATAPVVTVTAPTPTRTKTKGIIATTTVLRTFSTTIVIKSTTTPPASASACKKSGGIMI